MLLLLALLILLVISTFNFTVLLLMQLTLLIFQKTFFNVIPKFATTNNYSGTYVPNFFLHFELLHESF